jgi:predicted DNA-binding antitoxin AbrB/MazE fold protein
MTASHEKGGPTMIIRAVFEKGVFRPAEPVKLPEGTMVEVQAPDETVDVRALVPPGTDEGLIQVYECLAQSFDTGEPEAAARHNEHQP